MYLFNNIFNFFKQPLDLKAGIQKFLDNPNDSDLQDIFLNTLNEIEKTIKHTHEPETQEDVLIDEQIQSILNGLNLDLVNVDKEKVWNVIIDLRDRYMNRLTDQSLTQEDQQKNVVILRVIDILSSDIKPRGPKWDVQHFLNEPESKENQKAFLNELERIHQDMKKQGIKISDWPGGDAVRGALDKLNIDVTKIKDLGNIYVKMDNEILNLVSVSQKIKRDTAAGIMEEVKAWLIQKIEQTQTQRFK